jgi:SAM-dependent methyltransferase
MRPLAGVETATSFIPRPVPQPYLSLEAELHDAFWEAEDDASEVRLMRNFLRKHPGTALEIGCGSGRLMCPLLAEGLCVEGLELSPDMLDLGRKRGAIAGLHPIVHSGDMTRWTPARIYQALLAPAFTLQLAPDPEAALHHWNGWLEPGGGLYLTVFMPYAELLGDLPENQWYPDHQVKLPGGGSGLLETRHTLDRERQIIHREHRYSLTGPNPREHQSRQSIRWIEHAEMIAILNRAGFRMDRFFLDFDPARITVDPDREDFDGILTYEAVKRS